MNNNVNIMQMVEHLLPGGAERMAVNISNLLAENNYKVVLCPTRAKGALESEVNRAVKLECLNKRSFLDIKAFAKFYCIVKKNKIQIIHAHSSSVVWATLLKLIRPKVKIIWHDHYGFSENLKDKDRPIIRYISFLFFGIIAVNEKLYQWSLKNCKVKKDKITLLKNFPHTTHAIKKTNNSIIKIVVLANLRPQKDHITFIQALAMIKETIAQKKVKIIFAGLFWEDEYYKSIKELLNQYDLVDSVEFLGSVNDVMSLLLTCDIGVLSSKSEGLPVSLLEYGVAALPVIVTDVGQCAEVVNYGQSGIVVPPSAPQEMAKALLDLIENPQKRVELGVALKERIEKEYGAKIFLKAYQQLITNV